MYLRPYQPADFESVYQLDRVCFEPRFRFSRSVMRRVVEAQTARVLLACAVDASSQERLLGFCAVEVQSHGAMQIGYIATLDVAPASRQQGLAKQLVAALETEVARAGAAWMYLHVFTGNDAAVRLYEGMGYTRVQRISGFYGRGYDAWVYRKQLRQGDAIGASDAL